VRLMRLMPSFAFPPTVRSCVAGLCVIVFLLLLKTQGDCHARPHPTVCMFVPVVRAWWDAHACVGRVVASHGVLVCFRAHNVNVLQVCVLGGSHGSLCPCRHSQELKMAIQDLCDDLGDITIEDMDEVTTASRRFKPEDDMTDEEEGEPQMKAPKNSECPGGSGMW